MKKRTIKVFGETSYLLGKGKDGDMYYLVKPKWDCGWYWGMGYIHSYTNNSQPERSRDIKMHTHFDFVFFHEKNGYDNFKEFFAETPLADKEIWVLMELMKSAYKLREMADLCYRGGANYTENPCAELLKDTPEYQRINDVLLPAIFVQVERLLAGGDVD